MKIDEKIKSMRLMPLWDSHSGSAVTGIIELCFDIYHANPNASKWVEIGSYIGESALIFSSFPFVEELNCIDPMVHISDNLNRPKDQLVYCFKRRLHHLRHKVKLHIEESEEYVKKVIDKSIDVVYIDGSHKYLDVLNDLNLWYPKLRSGGFLCGHDYKNGHEGVEQAVDEFVSRHQLNINKIYVDSSFMIRV